MNPENQPPNEPPLDGDVICPHCLYPNAPEAAFCGACGAPIGMVANVDPIQSIRSEGFGWRSSATGSPRWIILIGTWLVFLPFAATSLLAFFGEGPDRYNLLSPVVLLTSIGILFRVTRNHIVKAHAARRAKKAAGAGGLPPTARD